MFNRYSICILISSITWKDNQFKSYLISYSRFNDNMTCHIPYRCRIQVVNMTLDMIRVWNRYTYTHEYDHLPYTHIPNSHTIRIQITSLNVACRKHVVNCIQRTICTSTLLYWATQNMLCIWRHHTHKVSLYHSF